MAETKRRRRRGAQAERIGPMIAYRRTSIDTQDLGLEAQRTAIERAAEYRGWSDLVWIEDVGISGKNGHDRPGLQAALKLLRETDARGLVVSRLDRLTRNLKVYLEIAERAQDEGWGLVLLEPDVSTDDPIGRAMVQMLGVFAELERGMIVDRINAGFAAAKAQGRRFGHPSRIPPALRRRIQTMRSRGDSYPVIAARLTAEGIPTVTGKSRWQASTIWKILNPAP